MPHLIRLLGYHDHRILLPAAALLGASLLLADSVAHTLLAQQPQLYLLDEPANHLDLRHQHQILGLLQQLCTAHNKSVIMVLHDPNLAARYCDHVLLLHEDGHVEGGPGDVLMTADRLSALYGYPIKQVESAQQAIFVAG